MLEGGSTKSKLKKIINGTEKAWNETFRPVLDIASPYIGMAASAKTKNTEIGKTTTIILI